MLSGGDRGLNIGARPWPELCPSARLIGISTGARIARVALEARGVLAGLRLAEDRPAAFRRGKHEGIGLRDLSGWAILCLHIGRRIVAAPHCARRRTHGPARHGAKSKVSERPFIDVHISAGRGLDAALGRHPFRSFLRAFLDRAGCPLLGDARRAPARVEKPPGAAQDLPGSRAADGAEHSLTRASFRLRAPGQLVCSIIMAEPFIAQRLISRHAFDIGRPELAFPARCRLGEIPTFLRALTSRTKPAQSRRAGRPRYRCSRRDRSH